MENSAPVHRHCPRGTLPHPMSYLLQKIVISAIAPLGTALLLWLAALRRARAGLPH